MALLSLSVKTSQAYTTLILVQRFDFEISLIKHCIRNPFENTVTDSLSDTL